MAEELAQKQQTYSRSVLGPASGCQVLTLKHNHAMLLEVPAGP